MFSLKTRFQCVTVVWTCGITPPGSQLYRRTLMYSFTSAAFRNWLLNNPIIPLYYAVSAIHPRSIYLNHIINQNTIVIMTWSRMIHTPFSLLIVCTNYFPSEPSTRVINVINKRELSFYFYSGDPEP